jgi:hypothetical protein
MPISMHSFHTLNQRILTTNPGPATGEIHHADDAFVYVNWFSYYTLYVIKKGPFLIRNTD